MTPEHAKALLPIITAFAEGKRVETKSGNTWIVGDLYFDADPSFYRIAPEPDPYADLKAAQAAGKVIQRRDETGIKPEWYNITPEWTAPPEYYRIKPEPKRVLMTSEDLPDGPIWLKDTDGDVSLVTLLAVNGEIESSANIGFPEGFNRAGILWATSRKGPWNSFMKEVEE